MTSNGFTPTQQAMLDVLADGKPHTFDELKDCLPDELGVTENIFRHISAIRKRIRLQGQEIVCEFANRRKYYRHIVLLSSAKRKA